MWDLSTGAIKDAERMRALSEFLESMVDDNLGTFKTAQRMISNDTASIPVSTTISTVIVGDKKHISVLVAANALIIRAFKMTQ